MALRMIPIAAKFHRMQRFVRDMGGSDTRQGSDLVLSGEENERVKDIIDRFTIR
jgi:chemotaxis protein histidine kinase CheA